MSKLSQSVNFIAVWMIIAIAPGVWYLGLEKHFLSLSLLEWTCYIGSVISALGLFLKKEWARQLAVKVLFLSFFWVLYVVSFLIGPYFTRSVEWLSITYHIPNERFRTILVVLLILYMTWPVIVIYFLTHPKVKRIFDPTFVPEDESH